MPTWNNLKCGYQLPIYALLAKPVDSPKQSPPLPPHPPSAARDYNNEYLKMKFHWPRTP